MITEDIARERQVIIFAATELLRLVFATEVIDRETNHRIYSLVSQILTSVDDLTEEEDH